MLIRFNLHLEVAVNRDKDIPYDGERESMM